jgi:3-isopropylmalate/(R)-2-methylmalate dehydratase large subunit
MKKKPKIPTKAELLQLQKLYKTDEKIGERLGGVPAYLVAYWRRKKNIPRYSLPKFSENEVRTLWERYGDDEKAGLELGISKAAFYNWRRRYGLKEKPAFLKLEQLEFNFPGSAQPSHASSLYGKRSIAQKIIARLADRETVTIGETVELEPDLVAVTERAAEIVEIFKQHSEIVWNFGKIGILLDHHSGQGNHSPADSRRQVREFARRQGIKTLFELAEGVCHQLPVERGLILPGSLVLGSGRCALAYGCMSALAVATDAEGTARVWESGRYSMTVPETMRMVISGRRLRGMHSADLALNILNRIGGNGAKERVIEYGGSVVSQMSIGERFTLSHLSAFAGAKAAICSYDATARRYLTGRTVTRYQPIVPDKDAEYTELYQVNVDDLTPQIACHGNFNDIRPAAELEDRPVHQVVIGGCTSGRFEDLRIAADILKGKRTNGDCRVMVIPGSQTVYLEALKKGLIRVFIEAGAVVVHPGCCSADFRPAGLIGEGERCLTTSTTGFADNDNSEKSEVCFCSPATAAASALNGAITDPTRYRR